MNNNTMQEGHGTLFQNKFKENSNQPDMTGTVMVNGIEWRVAGWTKYGKSGNKFLAIRLTDESKNEKAKEKSSGADLPF